MKSSVLILDDVWEYIDLLKLECPISKDCCRLVISTRSLEVCRQIDCEERIAVDKLNEDEAWKLFSETLGEEIRLSPQVEEIAKYVAKLGGGLPLGIITVGGSMKGETTIHIWKNTLVELRESLAGQDGMEEVEVFKVLRHSFDRLNKHGDSERSEFNLFQLCFLYCSLYPEDHEIPREELVRKLISEGLLERRKSRREQVDQGHIIVDILVKVCLLESCVDFIDRKCVKMHDLVRGMALKISGGKYMVRAGDKYLKEIPMEQEWTEQLEKVSLMRNDIRRIGEGTSPNCPNLSALLLQHNYNLQFIPDPFFGRMQGLRTLDLSETRIKMLPNSISDLKSHKALLLGWCQMLQHVPNLRKLKALKELNLAITAIEEVPQGVEELLNLKVLSLDAAQLKVLPRGLLLRLVGLQILRLPCHVQVAIEEIQNLKQLEKFSGGVKNVHDLNSFITSRVHDHTIYTIQVGSVGEEIFTLGNHDEKEMILTKCNLTVADEEILGQDINYLTMRQCEGLSKWLLDDLSRFRNPTSLRNLAIERCGGIEYILRSEPELASQISTLGRIYLGSLEDLKGLVDKGASAAPPLVVFSSLTWQRINKCNKMRRLGLSLPELPKLEGIEISECEEIEEIFKNELGRGGMKKEEIGDALLLSSSLRRLQIYKCNKVRKLGLSLLGFPNLQFINIRKCLEIEELFEDHQGTCCVTLPKLKALRLEELPRLKSVCKAPIISNSIQQISIFKCPRLMKKLPLLHSDHPPHSPSHI